MAASTISNSGGPGSSTQLSPMTIKVRDKIIEQFANQSLDEMNESLKKLLANEEDEQKRLGVLAARVFILRQRIAGLSGEKARPVLSSKSPKASDLADDATVTDSEWTRLRIIKDCEVNSVRFPKGFVIDVKSEDALKLIEAGNAERNDNGETQKTSPVKSDTPPPNEKTVGPSDDGDASQDAAVADEVGEAGSADDDMANTEMTDEVPDSRIAEEAKPEADITEADDSDTDFIAQLAAQEIPAEDDPDNVDLSVSDVMPDGDITAAPVPEVADAEPVALDANETVPVIEAPSAEDVTAALEALGVADNDVPADEALAEPDSEANKVAPGAATTIKTDELEALLGNTDSDDSGVNNSEADKPASWFEAQQNAETNDRATGSEDGPTGSEGDVEQR